MRVLVIGGSQGIGRQVVSSALAAGHTVTVFSRHPESLDIRHPRLHLQAGTVLNAAIVEEVIINQDAVICTLGLPTLQAIGSPVARHSYVLSEGTNNILQAMARQDVKRFICVTAIGTGDSIYQCTLFARVVLRYGLRWLFKEKDRQEQLIKTSNLAWTIVRPSALTNGQSGKKSIMKDDNLRLGTLTHIARADVAQVIVTLLSQQNSYHKAISLSYAPRLGDSIRWVAGYFGLG